MQQSLIINPCTTCYSPANAARIAAFCCTSVSIGCKGWSRSMPLVTYTNALALDQSTSRAPAAWNVEQAWNGLRHVSNKKFVPMIFFHTAVSPMTSCSFAHVHTHVKFLDAMTRSAGSHDTINCMLPLPMPLLNATTSVLSAFKSA